ncbi:MAG: hypothetical protein LVQ95_05310 [Candidatus Micrarchaeales archaeon]|nr:hypothetical protein [Candidatus Micrarchaeales archaeon]
MRVYITHCSAKKGNLLKEPGEKATPDRLYTAAPTRRFMKKCKEREVDWAIFSDRYRVWFPNTENSRCGKSPGSVTVDEFAGLVRDFDNKLWKYGEVMFYNSPGRFHRLYKRLLDASTSRDKIKMITHHGEIVR